jgi:hypothetical protein
MRPSTSGVTWYSELQFKGVTIKRGTVTGSHFVLHAFASIPSNGSKIHNVAMVTRQGDTQSKPEILLISWLELGRGMLQTTQCQRYTMPKDVQKAMNAPTLLVPRRNPYCTAAALVKAEPAAHALGNSDPGTATLADSRKKGREVQSVLSDEELGDGQIGDADKRALEAKNKKLTREVKDMKSLLEAASVNNSDSETEATELQYHSGRRGRNKRRNLGDKAQATPEALTLMVRNNSSFV